MNLLYYQYFLDCRKPSIKIRIVTLSDLKFKSDNFKIAENHLLK